MRLLVGGKPIGTEHLSRRVLGKDGVPAPGVPPISATTGPAAAEITGTPRKLRARVGEVEREAIVKALDRSRGNKSHAARALGITRRNLREKMKRYAIPDPRAR